ncbi:MAG: rod shape-determining protein MreD [Ignavibacteriota bacterium]|mgnify:CR=1 FL=1|jgi:rod shape-determining protein MreD|nr:rod shape-determining protein MreD [Ignavibacteriota bacterium]MBW7842587.1 rod shape-determining protein MreD [Ignavibacterium sp.]MCO6447601.1 rod shape-determining protein MreD [Ignavibacterium album]MCZ2269756.1 rod shape-determining protein MreD [Ignavibacteriales bacterium]MDX9711989.1 rod shape-determining protein MreD [Ignavibacteriaceae bacterium]
MIKPAYILSFVLFFPLLLIQTTIIPLVAIDTIIPDLIIIILVYYSITQGQIYGTVLGFIYGFLFDIITGSLLGSTMISKTIAGFTAGYFSSENKRDQYLISYNFALIVLLASLIESTISAFFSSVSLNTNIFILFIQYALFPALYTSSIALLGMIFYPKRRLF